MSGFKRMQSKVFWGRMASQDFENAPLLHTNNNYITPKIYQNSYCNFGRDSDTDDKNSNDSIQSFNTTAINVLRQEDCEKIINNIDPIDNCKFHGEIQCEKHEKIDNNAINNDENFVTLSIQRNSPRDHLQRPISLLDNGHGSLDSGFSDSERPKCSKDIKDIDVCCLRRRKKRRKRSRDTRDIIKMNVYRARLNLSQTKNELLSNPTYTSTPKRDSSELRGRFNSKHNGEILQLFDQNSHTNHRIKEEQVDATVQIPPTCDHINDNEDCFENFLYANEPPEDDDVPSTSSGSSSRDLTSSFVQPWCNKISTESSLISSSKSLDRNRKIIIEEKIYSSVKTWLKDLMLDVEDDFCITLQSKALPKRKPLCGMNQEEQTRDLKMMTAKATAAATELLVRADNFTKNIQDVVAKISHLEGGRSGRELLRHIEEEAFSILSELGAPPPRRIRDGSVRSILSQIESLSNIVNLSLDTRLDFYIERVVRGLEDAPKESGSVARGALAALTALGLAGVRAGNSIARCSGVRALLTSLISASRLSSELRASTLRALASVCCCPLAINHFVKDGGPEILMDLLVSKKTPESEKMEATALVVQITAPWIDALGLVHLEPFADILISVLTDLSEETTCGQTLLLCAAALNNLVDSKKCSLAVVRYDSVRRLLRCVKKSSGPNIWLLEQVASFINKLAKSSEIRTYLAKARASVALVSFLRMAPPGLEDAYKRLSITAATALTRLCVDEEIARQVVAVGGDDCLPKRYLYDNNNDNGEQLGLLNYSKSLRLACKRAAKRIDDAKACDYSM